MGLSCSTFREEEKGEEKGGIESIQICEKGEEKGGIESIQICVLGAGALEIDNSSSTIENVKNLIKNKEEGKELPMDELDLVFQGTILEEGRMLSYYNIQHGSTLNMAFQLRGETVQVILQDEFKGWTWTIENIGESDTLDDLKKKIEDVIGIEPDERRLLFFAERLKEGVILDQMRLIQNKVLESGDQERIAWMCKYNGRPTISMIDVPPRPRPPRPRPRPLPPPRHPDANMVLHRAVGASIVYHCPKWADGSMQISVLGASAKQQWITLEIENSSSTIENVKNVIKNRGGKELRMDELDLVFRGTILEEGKTLSYYNIQHGSKLNMAFQLRGETVQIILQDGAVVTTWTIEIGESDTLDDLKKKIKDLSGISPYQNTLDFNGTSLKEGVILDQMRLIQSEVLESGDQNRIVGMYKHNGRPTILGNIVADGSSSPPKNDDASDDNEVANSLKGDDWVRLTSRLRAVPNISMTKFVDAVELFEKNPTLIRIFFSLNPQEKEAWLVRKLGN